MIDIVLPEGFPIASLIGFGIGSCLIIRYLGMRVENKMIRAEAQRHMEEVLEEVKDSEKKETKTSTSSPYILAGGGGCGGGSSLYCSGFRYNPYEGVMFDATTLADKDRVFIQGGKVKTEKKERVCEECGGRMIEDFSQVNNCDGALFETVYCKCENCCRWQSFKRKMEVRK